MPHNPRMPSFSILVALLARGLSVLGFIVSLFVMITLWILPSWQPMVPYFRRTRPRSTPPPVTSNTKQQLPARAILQSHPIVRPSTAPPIPPTIEQPPIASGSHRRVSFNLASSEVTLQSSPSRRRRVPSTPLEIPSSLARNDSSSSSSSTLVESFPTLDPRPAVGALSVGSDSTKSITFRLPELSVGTRRRRTSAPASSVLDGNISDCSTIMPSCDETTPRTANSPWTRKSPAFSVTTPPPIPEQDVLTDPRPLKRIPFTSRLTRTPSNSNSSSSVTIASPSDTVYTASPEVSYQRHIRSVSQPVAKAPSSTVLPKPFRRQTAPLAPSSYVAPSLPAYFKNSVSPSIIPRPSSAQSNFNSPLDRHTVCHLAYLNSLPPRPSSVNSNRPDRHARCYSAHLHAFNAAASQRPGNEDRPPDADVQRVPSVKQRGLVVPGPRRRTVSNSSQL